MKATIQDLQGRAVSFEAKFITQGEGSVTVLSVESLDEIASKMGAPTSSATSALGATTTPASQSSHLKYVEPDPRSVKCPVCPHMASNHTDSGCIQTNVADREHRQPGVMGYCKCSRTYKQVMLSHKEAALAEGFTE